MEDIFLQTNSLNDEVMRLQKERLYLLEASEKASKHLRKVIKECSRRKIMNDQAAEKLTILADQLRDKDAELIKAKNDAIFLREELERTHEQLGNLESELRNYTEDYSSKLETATAELDQSREQMKKYVNTEKTFMAQLQNANDRVVGLEVDIANLQNDVGVLLEENSIIPHLERENAQLKDDLLELNEAHRQLVQMQNDHRKLEEETKILRESQSQFEFLKQERDGIYCQLQELEKRICELNAEENSHQALCAINAERLESLAKVNSSLKAEIMFLREGYPILNTAETQTTGCTENGLEIARNNLHDSAGVLKQSFIENPPGNGYNLVLLETLQNENSVLKMEFESIKAILLRKVCHIRTNATSVLESPEGNDGSTMDIVSFRKLLDSCLGETHPTDCEAAASEEEENSDSSRKSVALGGNHTGKVEPGTIYFEENSQDISVKLRKVPQQPSSAVIEKDPKNTVPTPLAISADSDFDGRSVSSPLSPTSPLRSQIQFSFTGERIIKQLENENYRLMSEIDRIREDRDSEGKLRSDKELQLGKRVEELEKSCDRLHNENIDVLAKFRTKESVSLDWQRRCDDALKHLDDAKIELEAVKNERERREQAISSSLSEFNDRFGFNLISFEDGMAIIFQELEERTTSLLHAQSELKRAADSAERQLMEISELRDYQCRLKSSYDTLQQFADALVLKIKAQSTELDSLKEKSVEWLNSRISISQELENSRALQDTAIASLEKEKREKERVTQICTDLVLRDEEKSNKFKAENKILRRSLKEIKQTHHITLVKLSDVESNHAYLLRKIIAWGSPGPDEVILAPSKEVEPNEPSEKHYANMFKAFLYQRWALFTLRSVFIYLMMLYPILHTTCLGFF